MAHSRVYIKYSWPTIDNTYRQENPYENGDKRTERQSLIIFRLHYCQFFFCISLPFNCPLSFASHRRRKIRFPSEKLKFTRWRSWKKDARRFSRKCQEMTNVENRMGH